MKDLNTPLHILAYDSNRRISRAEGIIAKFKVEFEKDPVYALSWSDNMLLEVARLSAHQQLQKQIASLEKEGKDVVATLIAGFTNKVIRDAQNTSTSSSAMTVLMAKNTKVAEAEILELLLGLDK